ncbi:tyrosine-type recombinase/integrase [Pseudoalteromonas luteoviolacea]|uniref:tyrosine-type recombinase/integrase n=1 Tax=Pseudoalteromonas luteoviolacea TaxID=43657 RepID=UPI0011501476|nr:site-specific integrase [Pseudoalteromonas luteoviolacea]TQF66188.1 site-specific integrase [Pseudoalteromonas luteoviolacea]
MYDRLSHLIRMTPPEVTGNHLIVHQHSTMTDLIIRDNSCPMYTYINGLSSDTSKATARRVLKAIAKSLGAPSIYRIDWTLVSKNDVNSMLNLWQKKKLAPDTISLYLSVLKSVIKEAFLLELISTRRFESIKSVSKPAGSRIKEHHILTPESFESLLELVKHRKQPESTAIRDQTIFHVLVGAGLRRFEIAGLQCEDVDHENKRLKFIGKGNKERAVKVHELTYQAICQWLNLHPTKTGPLFIRLTKGGFVYYKMSDIQALSGNAIYDVCKKYGLLEGKERVPPHSLRRSYATWLYNNDSNLKNISKLLGHASTKTTERYVQTSQQEIDDTVTNNLFKR